MDSDDPFSGLGGGGLGSGLGASFGQGRTPFRSVKKKHGPPQTADIADQRKSSFFT